jgi:hypothetical protein
MGCIFVPDVNVLAIECSSGKEWATIGAVCQRDDGSKGNLEKAKTHQDCGKWRFMLYGSG